MTTTKKSPYIGGQASELCCKGVVEFVSCGSTHLDKVDDLVQSRFLRVFTYTEFVRVIGKLGAFRVTMKGLGQHLREGACIGCGECAEAVLTPEEKRTKEEFD